MSCNDFELEEREDEEAPLPAITELLITCHLPLSRGLHAGLWRQRDGEVREEELWKKGAD